MPFSQAPAGAPRILGGWQRSGWLWCYGRLCWWCSRRISLVEYCVTFRHDRRLLSLWSTSRWSATKKENRFSLNGNGIISSFLERQFYRSTLSLSLSLYIYIYIYIVIHRQICFVLSELFSVARQARFPKLWSKSSWLKRHTHIYIYIYIYIYI